MVLDGTLAYAELRGDILAGATSQNQFHDLALSWSQTRNVVIGDLTPCDERARVTRPSWMTPIAGGRITVAHWNEKLRTCGTMPRVLRILGCRGMRTQRFQLLALKRCQLLFERQQFIPCLLKRIFR